MAPQFVAYHIASSSPRSIGISLEVAGMMANGHYFFREELRWSASGLSLPIGEVGRLAVAEFSDDPIHWKLLPKEREVEFHEVAMNNSDDAILSTSGRAGASLFDTRNDNRVIARHAPEKGIDSLSIVGITFSPDRDYIGYNLHVLRPHSFAIPKRSYIVPMDRSEQPRLLASPVYGPLQWHPKKRLVYALSKSKDGELGIYSWEY